MRLGCVPFRSDYTPGRLQPCSELGRKLYFLHFKMTRPFIPAHGGFVNDCHLRAINSAARCFSLTWERPPLPLQPRPASQESAAPLHRQLRLPHWSQASATLLSRLRPLLPGGHTLLLLRTQRFLLFGRAPNPLSCSPTLLSSFGLEAQPSCRRGCLHPSRS